MFDSIRQSCPDAKSMMVFCGVGNNAGDGYIIAELALEQGISVRLLQLGDSQLKGDALLAKQLYLSAGGEIERFDENNCQINADIVVDALFGTGLDRVVIGEWEAAIDLINNSDAYIASVDIPSGLSANSGVPLGRAVKANETVTFIARKRGMYTGKARDYVGKLTFSDLSVPEAAKRALNETVIKPSFLLMQSLALPKRARSSHKGSHGHVLFIGGALGMSGAVRMTAEAALTVGAGLVTVVTHPDHAAWLNLTRPELMVKGINSAKELSSYLLKADVIAIGPGLGQDVWGQELFHACLATEHDKIIDADALNLLSKISALRDNWVLTPHPGEAARLLGLTTADVEKDRFSAIKNIQQNYGGVTVLKGAGTIVADEETFTISELGNPGMAVGGMGDVLTGVIAGLRAQGLSLRMSARVGVTIHAKAADQAVGVDGERGLMASDLFPYLRKLVN